jgi:membrane protein involved in colicin uptake
MRATSEATRRYEAETRAREAAEVRLRAEEALRLAAEEAIEAERQAIAEDDAKAKALAELIRTRRARIEFDSSAREAARGSAPSRRSCRRGGGRCRSRGRCRAEAGRHGGSPSVGREAAAAARADVRAAKLDAIGQALAAGASASRSKRVLGQPRSGAGRGDRRPGANPGAEEQATRRSRGHVQLD